MPVVSKNIIETGKRVSPCSRYWIYRNEVYSQHNSFLASPTKLFGELSPSEVRELGFLSNYGLVVNKKKKETVLARYKENISYNYIIQRRYYQSGVVNRSTYFYGLSITKNKIDIQWTQNKSGAFEMNQEIAVRTKRMIAAENVDGYGCDLHIAKGNKLSKETIIPSKEITRFDLIDID
jgi:hypothetical protein